VQINTQSVKQQKERPQSNVSADFGGIDIKDHDLAVSLRDDLTSEDEGNPLIGQIGETVRINNILITNNTNGGNSSNMNIGSGAITFGGNITRQ